MREVTAHEEGTIAKEGVAVRTGGGRTVVGVAAYMDHVLALGPDAFASLAPEISCLSSRKQTQKAHELTLQWLDACLQRLPQRVRRRWCALSRCVCARACLCVCARAPTAHRTVATMTAQL